MRCERAKKMALRWTARPEQSPRGASLAWGAPPLVSTTSYLYLYARTPEHTTTSLRLRSAYQRKLDKAGLARRVVHPLHRFPVIARLGPKNIGHESLRIAVVQRAPARLDLHHDAMSREKNMIRGRQQKLIKQRFVRRERRRLLQALAITAPENVRRNHELIPAHLRIARHFIRIHVDELHHPVRIGPAGGSDQIRDRLPADFCRRRQHLRAKNQHIRPPRCFPLIVHQPLRPG